MAYSTRALLEQRIGVERVAQIARDTPADTAATIDALVLQACEDADALVDGYLGGKYKLPLASAPRLVIATALDIAIYNLHTRRPNLAVPEDVAERHKNAVKLLDTIARGLVTLGMQPAPDPSPLIPARADGPERVFTRDTLAEYC